MGRDKQKRLERMSKALDAFLGPAEQAESDNDIPQTVSGTPTAQTAEVQAESSKPQPESGMPQTETRKQQPESGTPHTGRRNPHTAYRTPQAVSGPLLHVQQQAGPKWEETHKRATFWLSLDFLEELDAFCRRTGLSKAQVIERGGRYFMQHARIET